MKCYRSGGCGPYEMCSCNECPASKPEYLTRNNKIDNSMTFNAKKLEMLIDKIYHEKLTPSMHMFCPPSIIDDIKEHWDNNGPVKAEFHVSPCEDDRIWVIPKEELEKPIKLVIPEEQQRLRQYLGIEEIIE